MTGALLPAGLFALYLGASSFRDVRQTARQDVLARADALSRVSAARFERDFATLRALLAATSSQTPAACAATLAKVAARDDDLSAISRTDAAGERTCGAMPSAVIPSSLPTVEETRRVISVPGGLVLTLADADLGPGMIVARTQAPLLPAPARRLAGEQIALLASDGRVIEADGFDNPRAAEALVSLAGGVRDVIRRADDDHDVAIKAPLGDGGPLLVISQPVAPLTIKILVGALIPVLMWLLAVGTGWLAVRWLMVHPLAELRGAIARYAEGGAPPGLGAYSRSTEVAALGSAFDDLTNRIGRHEDEQAAALLEQRRLAREVHHRVKNNLQIVTSLLSIQSREAETPPVAAAYRSIQRRVNALALVHRWMYEGEVGVVDLKPLVGDLCAAFQGASDAAGRPLAIRYEVDRATITQDTAVPVAFLLTEVLTAAEKLDGVAVPAILVTARPDGPQVELRISSNIFSEDDLFGRHRDDAAARIARGMARQLRGALSYDPAGSYAIRFARVEVTPVGAPEQRAPPADLVKA